VLGSAELRRSSGDRHKCGEDATRLSGPSGVDATTKGPPHDVVCGRIERDGLNSTIREGAIHVSTATPPVDVKAAEDHLMKFLSVEGVTGQEAAIAAAVSDELKKVGVPESAIRFDSANKRIPLPTQTGNLLIDLPGTRSGPRLLFATHLDTVPLCAGAKPKREGNRIVSDGTTALGGDNRTRLRGACHTGRDAPEGQTTAPADHAPLYCARGERAAWRP